MIEIKSLQKYTLDSHNWGIGDWGKGFNLPTTH